MILESAILYVKQELESNFERDFREAGQYISAIKGYIDHRLYKCMEQNGQYLLCVEWETLEDHTIGFRQSKEYLSWKTLLHHYYEPFPVVEHYQQII